MHMYTSMFENNHSQNEDVITEVAKQKKTETNASVHARLEKTPIEDKIRENDFKSKDGIGHVRCNNN